MTWEKKLETGFDAVESPSSKFICVLSIDKMQIFDDAGTLTKTVSMTINSDVESDKPPIIEIADNGRVLVTTSTMVTNSGDLQANRFYDLDGKLEEIVPLDEDLDTEQDLAFFDPSGNWVLVNFEGGGYEDWTPKCRRFNFETASWSDGEPSGGEDTAVVDIFADDTSFIAVTELDLVYSNNGTHNIWTYEAYEEWDLPIIDSSNNRAFAEGESGLWVFEKDAEPAIFDGEFFPDEPSERFAFDEETKTIRFK